MGYLHAIAGGFQHRLRGAGILGLEVAVERVDEKNHVAIGCAAITEVIPAPARQRAGSETERPLQPSRDQIRNRCETCRHRCIAWQVGYRAVASAVAALRLVVRQEFDLHARHVDAGRTFALAALARDAQVERVLDGILAFFAQLSGKREAKRVRPSAG